MKKFFTLLMLLSLSITLVQAQCPTTAVVDTVEYGVVQIGTQCWTSSNIRNLRYADAVSINPVPRIYTSDNCPNITPEQYGYLYTMEAATRNGALVNGVVRGVCPDGWHIPTQDDISNLITAASSVSNIMSTNSWLPINGTNTSGFNLLPAGSYNHQSNSYDNYGVLSALWVAEPGSSVYHACEFGAMCGYWEMVPGNSHLEISVRCVCDAANVPSTTCTGTARSNETSYENKVASVKDADDNSYPVVEINHKCWMKKNLILNNGLTAESDYFYPGNDVMNKDTYGLLYTHASAATSCPIGWRLPTPEELSSISSDFDNLELPSAGMRTTIGYQNFFQHSAYVWATATGLPNTAYYAATYNFNTTPMVGSMNAEHAASVRCIREN